MRSEAKVGIFVFLVIVMLFILTTQVNKISSATKDGYPISVELKDASGLEKFAKVKINGVEVGYVKDVSLRNNKPFISMLVYDNVSVPSDSMVILAQESMLGGKYIEIKPGSSTTALGKNGVLNKQRVYASFDQTSDEIYKAAEDFRRFIEDARDVVNAQSREDLKESFANLRDITENFKVIIEKNEQNINDVIIEMRDMARSLAVAGNKFGTMSDQFKQSAETINKKLPDIMAKLDDTVTNADDILKDNKKPLNETILSAKRFFDKGGDALKKIDTMMAGATKTRLTMGFRAEKYFAFSDYAKGVFDITYQPNPTRYYMGSIIGAPDYSKVDVNHNVIEPDRYTKSKVYYSAQVGKRYGDLLVRAGMIESTAGGGVDYYMLNDDLKASLELYDVSSFNDKRGDNPHAKFYLRYALLDHIDLYAGYDNFLNQNIDSFYLGAGIRFVADDVKDLVTGSAISGAVK
jgi:phospholipid/cholesterol/gamma-HCH transport system substrate-binding protein